MALADTAQAPGDADPRHLARHKRFMPPLETMEKIEPTDAVAIFFMSCPPGRVGRPKPTNPLSPSPSNSSSNSHRNRPRTQHAHARVWLESTALSSGPIRPRSAIAKNQDANQDVLPSMSHVPRSEMPPPTAPTVTTGLA
ncbi:hypothetical protein GGTG_13126 [Gaeumannomyces tritici R3-111a-1]|uniref:Uncharacterized protein n=1 Tax=Gaeumannomyces tritici (strain R3-111a-1) TaxID=644352 RepID=J3PHZ5_GAET3|nr:hypothetical protein GGTG_13126 [Gaeumannomyces tritici R3-111a-1]EJT69507.1 hypothetical protein GGTG_13126 [Gaeumannomyces tritici R3-111a-1]